MRRFVVEKMEILYRVLQQMFVIFRSHQILQGEICCKVCEGCALKLLGESCLKQVVIFLSVHAGVNNSTSDSFTFTKTYSNFVEANFDHLLIKNYSVYIKTDSTQNCV